MRILIDSWTTTVRVSSQARQQMVRISQRLLVRITAATERGDVLRWSIRILMVRIRVRIMMRMYRRVQHDIASQNMVRVHVQAHPWANPRLWMLVVDTPDDIIADAATHRRRTAAQRCDVDTASDRATLMVRVRSSHSGHSSRTVHHTTDGTTWTSWRI